MSKSRRSMAEIARAIKFNRNPSISVFQPTDFDDIPIGDTWDTSIVAERANRVLEIWAGRQEFWNDAEEYHKDKLIKKLVKKLEELLADEYMTTDTSKGPYSFEAEQAYVASELRKLGAR